MKNKNFIKILTIVVAINFLSSCAGSHLIIAEKTSKIAAQNGFDTKIYETKDFKIFTLQKITDQEKPLRIYFEGDGKAFINKNTPSPNPTPTSYFLTNLILQDNSPNILYIARPCQFVEDKKCYGGNNPQSYWTDNKFSPEILNSIYSVIKNFSRYKLELIGYSGGAEIAKYFAANNFDNNLKNLRTIAGNVDEEKFNEIHKISTKDKKYSDRYLIANLQNVPQIHFVGAKDDIVPQKIAENYLQKLENKNCTQLVIVESATHYSGWQENWGKLSRIEPFCKIERKSQIEK